MITWLRCAIVDWLVIFSCFYASVYIDSYLTYFISIVLIGSRQHSLSILGHEGAHALICNKYIKLNDFLCNFFCFWPLCVNLKSYRRFHFAHHRHNGTEKDPELIHKRLISQWDTKNINMAILYSLTDLIGGGIPNVLLLMYLVNRRRLKHIIPILSIIILINIMLILSGYTIISLLWNISLLTSFWFFFRIRVWTEHVRVENGRTHKLKQPNKVIEWLFFPCRTWMHDLHHIKPNVPFYKLNYDTIHNRITLKELIFNLFT